jgi:hypothetical protein
MPRGAAIFGGRQERIGDAAAMIEEEDGFVEMCVEAWKWGVLHVGDRFRLKASGIGLTILEVYDFGMQFIVRLDSGETIRMFWRDLQKNAERVNGTAEADAPRNDN